MSTTIEFLKQHLNFIRTEIKEYEKHRNRPGVPRMLEILYRHEKETIDTLVKLDET